MNWFKRRAYARDAKTNFSWLLIGFPPGFSEKAWRLYPGISTTLQNKIAEGVSTERAATEIVAVVIPDLIDQWNDAEAKQRVLGQLRAIKNEDPTDPWAKGIAVLESQTFQWASAGKFEMWLRKYLMNEIIGALAGKTSEERRVTRMSCYVDETLLGRGDYWTLDASKDS